MAKATATVNASSPKPEGDVSMSTKQSNSNPPVSSSDYKSDAASVQRINRHSLSASIDDDPLHGDHHIPVSIGSDPLRGEDVKAASFNTFQHHSRETNWTGFDL